MVVEKQIDEFFFLRRISDICNPNSEDEKILSYV